MLFFYSILFIRNLWTICCNLYTKKFKHKFFFDDKREAKSARSRRVDENKEIVIKQAQKWVAKHYFEIICSISNFHAFKRWQVRVQHCARFELRVERKKATSLLTDSRQFIEGKLKLNRWMTMMMMMLEARTRTVSDYIFISLFTWLFYVFSLLIVDWIHSLTRLLSWSSRTLRAPILHFLHLHCRQN
jgi:hypothetical protein